MAVGDIHVAMQGVLELAAAGDGEGAQERMLELAKIYGFDAVVESVQSTIGAMLLINAEQADPSQADAIRLLGMRALRPDE